VAKCYLHDPNLKSELINLKSPVSPNAAR
jgi:hypothetical protein